MAGKVQQHLCLISKDEWRRQLVSHIFAVTALRATRALSAVGQLVASGERALEHLQYAHIFSGNNIHVSQSEN